MAYREVPYTKAQRLLNEIIEHRSCIENLDYEIHRLAELYMEGQILEPVGKEQKRLQREIEKQQSLINKKSNEISRLQQRY